VGSLHTDLTSGSRDSLYRAVSYVQQCGGPSLFGPADNLANLMKAGQKALQWLSERQDEDSLVDEYKGFLRRWSPIFLD
jgi:hypothetical protein